VVRCGQCVIRPLKVGGRCDVFEKWVAVVTYLRSRWTCCDVFEKWVEVVTYLRGL
jgi:hypothetical protein